MACGRAKARVLSTDEGGDMTRVVREATQTRRAPGGTNDGGGMNNGGSMKVAAA